MHHRGWHRGSSVSNCREQIISSSGQDHGFQPRISIGIDVGDWKFSRLNSAPSAPFCLFLNKYFYLLCVCHRCADVLIRRGFDVTILEARERIGGRVHQVTTPPGHVVDVGANWIHGTEGNPILDLAKMTNTATHSVGVWNFLVLTFEPRIISETLIRDPLVGRTGQYLRWRWKAYTRWPFTERGHVEHRC